MKFEVEGKIGYCGPDDPTGEYYSITTDGGRNINFGLNANQWSGNIRDGIPNLPIPFYKNKRCRITIEILED
jgi:hypothetical protein